MNIKIDSVLVVPSKWKHYKKRKKEKNPRNKYTNRNLKRTTRSHRSIALDARLKAKKVIKVDLVPTCNNAASKTGKAVIRPVHINDIQFHDDYGYILHYCIFDDFKRVQPITHHFFSYVEIVKAYEEAVLIQTRQRIII